MAKNIDRQIAAKKKQIAAIKAKKKAIATAKKKARTLQSLNNQLKRMRGGKKKGGFFS